MIPIGDLCQIIGGGTPTKNKVEYYTGNIPWATVRDMNVDYLTQTQFKITANAVKDSSTNIIPRGNVVLATRVGLGKVTMLGQDTAINQDLRGFIPNDSNRLSTRYLFFWLKSINERIIAEGKGATVQGVTLPFVKALEIPLPPLNEQERIAAILDRAFEGIAKAKANAERNLENARVLFEGRRWDLFRKQQDNWERRPLQEVCEVKDGTHDSPKYQMNGIPFITQKNIRSDGLSFEKVSFISLSDHQDFYRRSNVAIGDILISMIGANRGMACIVDDDRVFSIKNVCLVKKSAQVYAPFLLHYLNTPEAKQFVRAESRGGAQEFIGLTALRNFPVPVPPVPEQTRIASALDHFHAEAQALVLLYRQKCTLLGDLKSSLLHQAFNGAI